MLLTGYSCGWTCSLPIRGSDARVAIKFQLLDNGEVSQFCSTEVGICSAGLVFTALVDAANSMPTYHPPVPSPVGYPGRSMSNDKSYLPVVVRWITVLLLRCDNANLHEWQRKYMALVIRQNGGEGEGPEGEGEGGPGGEGGGEREDEF